VEVTYEALTFEELRAANLARVVQFRDAQGRLSHPEGIENWDAPRWCMAVTGELGELANLLKKIERGDFTLDEVRGRVGEELADVAIYLDLLSARLGVYLAAAIVDKFNSTSERVGSEVRLPLS